MKAIMVMFDSLNRHMLPPYGCEWIKAPNFARLAEKTVVFDRCYAASLPCMPARRELHTGRYNFLHRSWGPIEPYDDSMPELLKKQGVYTHLVTDHHHYFEDGGCTYHTRYNSWEFARGQEYDAWKGQLEDPEIPDSLGVGNPGWNRQYWINRQHLTKEEDHPQVKTFQWGMEFIRKNHVQDQWFLQLETFDPHEPFFAAQKYRELYPHAYEGPHFDWPKYGRVSETQEQVQHCRYEYAALVSMCDAYLGQLLDLMDELNLWKDTMLIVNTDHGFFLGEKGWWAKVAMPFYNELVHLPLFVWDPRTTKKGERNDCLVQTIDLAPTLLEFFGCDTPKDMLGVPLRETIVSGKEVRAAALFGIHGGHVNCTDGRYVYMRSCGNERNEPVFNYTQMPGHVRGRFTVEEMSQASLAEGFPFTKGCPVFKIPAVPGKTTIGRNPVVHGTLLFDLIEDPLQEHPLCDPAIERHMIALMLDAMARNDAPVEQYERLGLSMSAPPDRNAWQ